MDGADMLVSMSNIVQMDRHQSDFHRGPMVNQEQNADTARQEEARRLASPTQPDKSEGKTIDPKAKREEERRKKRNRQAQMNAKVESETETVEPICGLHIDFEA